MLNCRYGEPDSARRRCCGTSLPCEGIPARFLHDVKLGCTIWTAKKMYRTRDRRSGNARLFFTDHRDCFFTFDPLFPAGRAHSRNSCRAPAGSRNFHDQINLAPNCRHTRRMDSPAQDCLLQGPECLEYSIPSLSRTNAYIYIQYTSFGFFL